MKISVALCAVSNISWVLAAPVVAVLKHANNQPEMPTIISPGTLSQKPNLRIPPMVTGVEHPGTRDDLEGRPDNRPFSPLDDVAPSEALSSPRPLTTAYLLSLRQGSAKTNQVQHPEIPDSSIVREEIGSPLRPSRPSIVELETQGNKPFYHRQPCTMHDGAQHFHEVRVYADTTVVSIGIIFIVAVAIFELWNPIYQTSRRIWYGEGRIRLEEEANEKAQLKQRYRNFILKPAPKPKSKLSVITEKPEEI
ncbi:hypothetical protein BJ170DRAFT_686024 [Xylariales sp. AK1849]|nr:hypothetical protein BJ170DRAFT_686024 [Xylariales sp. AK1849]